VKVQPIQTIQEYFQPNKKARALEKGCIVSKKGAIGLIFEGDMPLKKKKPKIGATIGAITGILLMTT
jgi:hypothetical protein